MTNLSMINTEVTTAIAQNTSEHSTESIKGIAWAINEYGPLVVALACFILAFVLLSRLIINQNNMIFRTGRSFVQNGQIAADSFRTVAVVALICFHCTRCFSF